MIRALPAERRTTLRFPGLIAGFEAFGRGLGTFDPTLYFYLDNQYLGSLLEGGVLGVTTLIITYVVGFWCGTRRTASKHAWARASACGQHRCVRDFWLIGD